MRAIKPVMFRNHPLGFLVGLVVPVAGWLALLWWWLGCFTTSLRIEPDRVVYGEGIFSRATNEVRLRDLRSIHVRQTLFQRVFGTGDVHLVTAGDQPEISMRGVRRPAAVRDEINTLRDAILDRT